MSQSVTVRHSPSQSVTVRHSHTKKVLKLLDLATLAKITWLSRGIKEVKNQGLFAGVSSVFEGC